MSHRGASTLVAMAGLASCLTFTHPTWAGAGSDPTPESAQEKAGALRSYRVSTSLLVLGTLSARAGSALLMAYALPGVLPVATGGSSDARRAAVGFLVPAFGLQLLGRVLQIWGAAQLIRTAGDRIAAFQHALAYDEEVLLNEDVDDIRKSTIALAVGWEVMIATSLAFPWVFGGSPPVCPGDPCSGIFLFGDFALMIAGAIVVIGSGAYLGASLAHWRRNVRTYMDDDEGAGALSSPKGWQF